MTLKNNDPQKTTLTLTLDLLSRSLPCHGRYWRTDPVLGHVKVDQVGRDPDRSVLDRRGESKRKDRPAAPSDNGADLLPVWQCAHGRHGQGRDRHVGHCADAAGQRCRRGDHQSKRHRQKLSVPRCVSDEEIVHLYSAVFEAQLSTRCRTVCPVIRHPARALFHCPILLLYSLLLPEQTEQRHDNRYHFRHHFRHLFNI